VKLYEFEGHKILTKVGIESPFFVVCENLDDVEAAKKRIKFPIVAKVQVLSGRRGKRGGVKVVANSKQLKAFCQEFFGKDFDGEQVKYILLSEKAEIEKELYASISYDTVLKIPFFLFCEEGGVDIEDVKLKNPEKIMRININPTTGISQKEIGKITKDEDLADFITRLWDVFCRFDCRFVEVNPLARVGEDYLAIDAKVILDDNGKSRQKEIEVIEKGASTAVPTKREIEAHKIDAEDYRGSAGSTFIEFDGDPDEKYGAGIAILASGGGASLLVMDAVVAEGGKCANYTEYSGNPSAAKVEKLTEITLSREGLAGCMVAGAVANFTDIYETLSGFANGLVAAKPKVDYPIVIRRGGPRQKEAFEMLEKLAESGGYDIHLFGGETPISVAAKKMVELSEKYKIEKDGHSS
jgi:citryl-CoA synthetase large subunit